MARSSAADSARSCDSRPTKTRRESLLPARDCFDRRRERAASTSAPVGRSSGLIASNAMHKFARSSRVEGASSRGCRGGWVSLSARICRAFPENGSSPVSASYRTTPTEYQSADSAAAAPVACSGAMYAGVPTMRESLSSSRLLTSPKSSSTTRPERETITLDGLTSRCKRPAACSASRPPASCASAARRRASALLPIACSRPATGGTKGLASTTRGAVSAASAPRGAESADCESSEETLGSGLEESLEIVRMDVDRIGSGALIEPAPMGAESMVIRGSALVPPPRTHSMKSTPSTYSMAKNHRPSEPCSSCNVTRLRCDTSVSFRNSCLNR